MHACMHAFKCTCFVSRFCMSYFVLSVLAPLCYNRPSSIMGLHGAMEQRKGRRCTKAGQPGPTMKLLYEKSGIQIRLPEIRGALITDPGGPLITPADYRYLARTSRAWPPNSPPHTILLANQYAPPTTYAPVLVGFLLGGRK